ncbi:MAG TPA: amphi-Trp domain-containing protein [Solirubrobacterales bacterium]|jgi:amphi-Trp domain-containing protein|nr:amphi-Trp domain-containing protein [Solirubrobacterales bacterium]
MELFEVEKRETVSRKEIATRLRRLANMLSSDDEEISFERGGMQFAVHVPEEVQLKVELEIESDERELEIELKW